MSDKRIIELDVTDVVEADDFLAIDSVSGTTRRIKPIKIGATYEIEDGDHEFTLIGSNGYEHTVHLPVDAVSMTQAEYDALTPEQKADGTTRFITDGQSDVESELWSKVGRQTLDTDSQVLSNAVNELKGDMTQAQNDISELNSSLTNKKKNVDVSVKAYWNDYTVTIEIAGAIPTEALNNTNTVVAVLPSDVPRPSTPKYGVMSCGGSSNRFVLVAIQTNGNILVYNYSGASTSYLYGSITFLH